MENTQPPSESSNARRVIDFVIMLIIAIVLGVGITQMSDSNPTSKLEGQPAPVFSLQSLDGSRKGAKDFAGKVVILDFWATWCPPCIKQMPALQELENDPGLKDTLKILSINTDDEAPTRDALIHRFLDKHGLELEVLIDDGVVSNLYGVRRIPTLVIIGPDGIVRYGSSGVLSESKLRKLIREAGAGN